MGYKFNPVTGKFEQQQPPTGGASRLTPEQKQDSDLRQTASQFGLSPEQVLYGTGKQAVAARKSYEKRTATSSTPYGTGVGTGGAGYSKAKGSDERVWASRPPSSVTSVTPDVPVTGQGAIDSMWQAVYDEAAAYRVTYGEEPPAAWWTARTSQIEAAQKRYDAEAKAGSAASAAAAKAAADAKAKEVERQRKIRGGQAAETFLREQAAQRKTDMLKRVAELYDPLKTKTKEDLARTLQAASDAFDLAEKQVGAAGAAYQQGITPTRAYSEIPLATFQTAENPLLAALQAQGAQTGEVTAATEQANQFMAQQSALEKWAAGQLNVGQQNYDIASQNAAKGALQAALMQLGGRRADVKTGVEQQFADALSEIAQKETGALSDVDQTIADLVAEADKVKANTLSEYGMLPKDEPKNLPGPGVNKPKPKPQVTTPTVPVVTPPKDEPKKKKPPLTSSTIRRS